jgi:hypothetical protein
MAADRFTEIERKLDSLVAGLDVVWRTMNEVESRLQVRMGVLHEEVLDRIAALAPDFSPIRQEFQRGDNELREEFDRRLVPLEVFVRAQRKPKP